MLFFSELADKTVYAEKHQRLGRLTDLVFLDSGQPRITKLTISAGSQNLIVPMTMVNVFNGGITLSSSWQPTNVADNELSMRRHLLDQQIIDIKGDKVVRVNDVAIQEKPYLIIAGVDVGVLGIARWLKIEQLMNKALSVIGKTATSDFLPWENIQPLELSRGKVVLKREETKLTKLRPEDLADHLERLSVRNLTKILDLLPNEYEADVVQNLNVSRQGTLFRTIRPQHAAQILSLIDPDEAADILLSLTPKRRDTIIPLLSDQSRTPITYLMSLSTTDIGEIMTNEYFTTDPDESVGNVKRRIKLMTSGFSTLSYIYVVNKKGELIGVCDLHELILQDTDVRIYKFMTQNVTAASLTTPPALALKKMVKYKIHALPIINEKRHILGIVLIDDLVESLQEKLT